MEIEVSVTTVFKSVDFNMMESSFVASGKGKNIGIAPIVVPPPIIGRRRDEISIKEISVTLSEIGTHFHFIRSSLVIIEIEVPFPDDVLGPTST